MSPQNSSSQSARDMHSLCTVYLSSQTYLGDRGEPSTQCHVASLCMSERPIHVGPLVLEVCCRKVWSGIQGGIKREELLCTRTFAGNSTSNLISPFCSIVSWALMGTQVVPVDYDYVSSRQMDCGTQTHTAGFPTTTLSNAAKLSVLGDLRMTVG